MNIATETASGPETASPPGAPRAPGWLPATSSRVAAHGPAEANRRNARAIRNSIAYHVRHPDRIERRLRELDREWDMERTLEANAATLALAGVTLGAFADRRFLILPAAVTAFLLQHALQGWCPPVPFFRRRGVRTAAEIARERYALKALRGDFEGTGGRGHAHVGLRVEAAFRAARP